MVYGYTIINEWDSPKTESMLKENNNTMAKNGFTINDFPVLALSNAMLTINPHKRWKIKDALKWSGFEGITLESETTSLLLRQFIEERNKSEKKHNKRFIRST